MTNYERILSRIKSSPEAVCTVTLIAGDEVGNRTIETWEIELGMFQHMRGHYDEPDVLTVLSSEGHYDQTFPSSGRQ